MYVYICIYIYVYILLIGVPCPAISCRPIKRCPWGYVRDENGCQTCRCKGNFISMYIAYQFELYNNNNVYSTTLIYTSFLINSDNGLFLYDCQ